MEIVEKYSHLNGEEYLIVHHSDTYGEIMDVIKSVDANKLRTKVSEEEGRWGELLYSPQRLNREFERLFGRGLPGAPQRIGGGVSPPAGEPR